MINGLDHDDGVEIDGKGLGHPGATLVAAAMVALDLNPEPVAQDVLITTLAAGFEVNNRLIHAIQPSAERFSQVYGVAQHQSIGAAVVAGRLLGLNPEQLHHAVGLAAALTPLPVCTSITGDNGRCCRSKMPWRPPRKPPCRR